MPQHKLPEKFVLQNGEVLHQASLHYEIEGEISNQKEIIWICHAFTGSATVKSWWPSLYFENGGFIDPKRHTVICANILGSCYGSTGPESINPDTNKKYGDGFPEISNRDVIKAFIDLRKFLNITNIDILIGGSLGGQQALEWSLIEPEIIQNQALIASNAKHSSWGIAFNELQRQAISLGTNNSISKNEAIAIARKIAMLSYRSYDDFELNQKGKNEQGDWNIVSYLNYQGEKFKGRFSTDSYFILSKMMDNHNIASARNGSLEQILSLVKTNTLCIGIDSDNLFPLKEQGLMAHHIPNAKLEIINSKKGHDAFLIEGNKISRLIEKNFKKNYYEKA